MNTSNKRTLTRKEANGSTERKISARRGSTLKEKNQTNTQPNHTRTNTPHPQTRSRSTTPHPRFHRNNTNTSRELEDKRTPKAKKYRTRTPDEVINTIAAIKSKRRTRITDKKLKETSRKKVTQLFLALHSEKIKKRTEHLKGQLVYEIRKNRQGAANRLLSTPQEPNAQKKRLNALINDTKAEEKASQSKRTILKKHNNNSYQKNRSYLISNTRQYNQTQTVREKRSLRSDKIDASQSPEKKQRTSLNTHGFFSSSIRSKTDTNNVTKNRRDKKPN